MPLCQGIFLIFPTLRRRDETLPRKLSIRRWAANHKTAAIILTIYAIIFLSLDFGIKVGTEVDKRRAADTVYSAIVEWRENRLDDRYQPVLMEKTLWNELTDIETKEHRAPIVIFDTRVYDYSTTSVTSPASTNKSALVAGIVRMTNSENHAYIATVSGRGKQWRLSTITFGGQIF